MSQAQLVSHSAITHNSGGLSSTAGASNISTTGLPKATAFLWACGVSHFTSTLLSWYFRFLF